MTRDWDEFDPEAPGERAVGREMVDESTGLGSVLAHTYRGEVDRETSWRARLDSTTNWAVTVIAGILAYAFSSDRVSHAILLVAMLIGVVFLVIEARRFQRYDVWRSRVRSIQENLLATALDPSQDVEQRDWRRELSESYRAPRMQLPFSRALSHRLRRVYLPLLVALGVVWLLRLRGASGSLVDAAGVFDVPGVVVLAVVGTGFLGLAALAFVPDAAVASEVDEAGDRGMLDRKQ
ncbi:DUF2270 domain-containing protein [Halorubellus sp. JP-L1]|uniref:DUF2270 domain-containing protein n=1 Tax=Halorubellus sp. JP-L1 TaxID=2715753 RepID=UPI00140770E0|nr:DUF2270 domain-containing protein [Halorubellus sp. JP-L1]NHN41191.1 DUF2270 domain-containing protein [Halorubellus sp. JP-L1]